MVLIYQGPVQKPTLPETNVAPESRPSQKERIVFQPSIFRCDVSFREGTLLGGIALFTPPGGVIRAVTFFDTQHEPTSLEFPSHLLSLRLVWFASIGERNQVDKRSPFVRSS